MKLENKSLNKILEKMREMFIEHELKHNFIVSNDCRLVSLMKSSERLLINSSTFISTIDIICLKVAEYPHLPFTVELI